MDKFLRIYSKQKMFSIPDKIQDSLTEKIKKSDFLVTDQKGVHRLIGVRYEPDKMDVPVITCICLRHEMASAKRIAFMFGKKIYFNSKISAQIFKYYTGENLRFEDYGFLVLLYADFYKKKNRKL